MKETTGIKQLSDFIRALSDYKAVRYEARRLHRAKALIEAASEVGVNFGARSNQGVVLYLDAESLAQRAGDSAYHFTDAVNDLARIAADAILDAMDSAEQAELEATLSGGETIPPTDHDRACDDCGAFQCCCPTIGASLDGAAGS